MTKPQDAAAAASGTWQSLARMYCVLIEHHVVAWREQNLRVARGLFALKRGGTLVTRWKSTDLVQVKEGLCVVCCCASVASFVEFVE